MKTWLTALGATGAALVSHGAWAQVQAQTAVSSQRVAVGDSIRVVLTVSGGASAPQLSDARLPVPPGMLARGPNVGQQSQISINNGRMIQSAAATLTWIVSTSKAGSFRLGPPSVNADGTRVEGKAIPVEVSPAGSGMSGGATRRNPDPFDFMDPFGRGSSLFPGLNLRSPFDDDPSEQQQEQEPPVPEDMRVEHAADPIGFLRATLTPNHVVVGQQVNLRVYYYGARGSFNEASPTEPSHADFLAYPNSDEQPTLLPMLIDGARWVGVKARDIPLFPLHSGTLRAGQMKMGFAGRGYPATGPNVGMVRQSSWAEVVVSEPPLKNRPPGYKIGDVGDYKLTANVEPREVMAGEAVSVVATLSGTGNVPFKLLTPERADSEWLEPSLSEKVEPVHGVVQGKRTFNYVVKLREPGTIDLGEISLPYYDPKRHDYATARAALGTVNVKVNPNALSAAKAAAADQPIDRLSDVLEPRERLGAWSAPQSPLSDRPSFWWVLCLAPLGIVFTGGALGVGRSLKDRTRARKGSLSAHLEQALREAERSAASDPRGTSNAVERAIFTAIELKLGLKARAILKTELAAALGARGVSAERAEQLSQVLEDCDALRFVGPASGVQGSELVARAATNIARLREEKLAPVS